MRTAEKSELVKQEYLPIGLRLAQLQDLHPIVSLLPRLLRISFAKPRSIQLGYGFDNHGREFRRHVSKPLMSSATACSAPPSVELSPNLIFVHDEL